MKMSISETVLEMHYHQPLMKLIRETYGVGPTGKFSFYKYSPQREVFLGFDQVYAMTELSDAEFFSEMKSSAMEDGYKLRRTFIAYFLQFKVVSELQKRQKKTPPQITSRPHYRSMLETAKNDRTEFSQHELLYNLNKNDGAMVYYACPMLFDKSALYEIEVSLDPLRLVDMGSCPSEFSDNSKHYVYFDQKQSNPIWCSEPVIGTAITSEQFAQSVINHLRQSPPEESARQVSQLLRGIKERLGRNRENAGGDSDNNWLAAVADCLTVVRLDERIESERTATGAGG